MSSARRRRTDLIVLVADKDMQEGLEALLSRPRALGIRPIASRVFKHDERDAGCYARAEAFLRPQAGGFDFALVAFDRHGCGSSAPTEEIETDLRARLERSGWAGRCDVVVIAPELENWVWSSSPNVAACLRWRGTASSLRQWLARQGHWPLGDPKPADPKAAVEAVLHETRERRTPRLYADLAATVSTRGCSDPSFNRLCRILRRWFPAQ